MFKYLLFISGDVQKYLHINQYWLCLTAVIKQACVFLKALRLHTVIISISLILFTESLIFLNFPMSFEILPIVMDISFIFHSNFILQKPYKYLIVYQSSSVSLFVMQQSVYDENIGSKQFSFNLSKDDIHQWFLFFPKLFQLIASKSLSMT